MSNIEYISFADLLMGRHSEYSCTEETATNLGVLWFRVNRLCNLAADANIAQEFKVTSGYRPGRFNKAAGGAERSAHVTCEAVDIADPEGKLDAWLAKNELLLGVVGLSREHESATAGWTHLDTRKRGGVYRTFKP